MAFTALVRDVFGSDATHGPYAVATSDEVRGSITFSLRQSVWQERVLPCKGVYVVLFDLRKCKGGWRAMCGRFFQPADEKCLSKTQSKGNPEMISNSIEELLSEAKRRGVDTSKPAALAALSQGDMDEAVALSTMVGNVLGSEAAGASALLSSSNLPRDGVVNNREALEQLGFVFGDEVDEVLISVQLPEGWRKECDSKEDPRHNKLVDVRGRKRAHVFIKTASYDYTGYVQWSSRFGVNVIVEDGRDKYSLKDNEEAPFVGVVMDGDTEIHRTEAKVVTRRDYKAGEQLHRQAHEWLMAKYPNADKPFAHWDD